ncbi:MAG: 2-hydroxyacid dehydrogenase [Desulfuromonadales bacterium]|nr:2-hydroxyacid dehydrogenase [Desulfuromonadales bacterium]MBN2792633.1 2-hydroxyacid dehydrogenase [Desulfuromonadales bacterium]
MNILFAAAENAWGGVLHRIRERLHQHEYTVNGSFDIDSLKGYDVLIPTMSRITPELIATADRLKLIQQCGSGLEGVDIAAALSKGINVANVPTDLSGNADSVAELGIYFMIGLSRDVSRMANSLKQQRMGEPKGLALGAKTVGIIGLGGIGKALVRRLKPFGVRLIGLKQTGTEAARTELELDWVGTPEQLPELLKQSDYVILALPVNGGTSGLFNEDTFALMKPTAFVINLARGGLIDRGALERALKTGQIAGAGLDVFWQEPPDPKDPVFQYNVLATPHSAGCTDVSIQGIAEAVCENIERTEQGLSPLNVAHVISRSDW